MSDESDNLRPGTTWLLNRITPEEGTVSDLYDKTDNEETEGQKRTIGYLVAALLIVGALAAVWIAGGGR